MNQLPSLIPALPEIVLACGALALLMLGAYRANSTRFVNIGAIVLLIVAILIEANLSNGATFGTSFVVDGFARFLKILAFAGSAFAILMSLDYQVREGERMFEFAVLILLSSVGMGMMISATDLIGLYLGLEL